MSKPNLVLVGAGGHAHACLDVIEQQDKYNIFGLVGLPSQINSTCMGHRVIGDDSNLIDIVKTCQYAMVALGQIDSNSRRVQIYQKIIHIGFDLPVIISPRSYVSPYAKIGAGSIVMHGAIIGPGSRVGINCIVNSNALLEHDASIGDHCHISTGAILNGGVMVHSGTFIGSGSCVKQGVTVGKNCLIGMGSVIRKNLNDESYYVNQGNDEK
jgi:sugar O-acyltransferase (sialic acid O-acetyltransferase NeuD family)